MKFYLYENIFKILHIFHWGMDVNYNAKNIFKQSKKIIIYPGGS